MAPEPIAAQIADLARQWAALSVLDLRRATFGLGEAVADVLARDHALDGRRVLETASRAWPILAGDLTELIRCVDFSRRFRAMRDSDSGVEVMRSQIAQRVDQLLVVDASAREARANLGDAPGEIPPAEGVERLRLAPNGNSILWWDTKPVRGWSRAISLGGAEGRIIVGLILGRAHGVSGRRLRDALYQLRGPFDIEGLGQRARLVGAYEVTRDLQEAWERGRRRRK